MIKAILIDDEVHCLDTLAMMLADQCADIQVLERSRSGQKAVEAIQKLNPDLIFLDIEMPGMNGFELLEKFHPVPFSVIFTTSYNQYAIKAIRFSALDYLLKPVDPKELINAVEKVRIQNKPPLAEQFTMLLNQLQNKKTNYTKIAIPTTEGFELIPADEVIRCEADDNYTKFYLRDKRRIIACRSLKEIEEQLEDFNSFIRVHYSFLVNLNEVSKYIRGEGGYLIMNDGSTVNVSRSRKELLMKKLQAEK